ncbi:MAG: UDP-N-acetylglucosamine 1-carboxyvinyltransferase [bacterium]|nr:UDP-N-acetylglucosamine 1-carboxyvinyltransferase [bacterium]
MKALKIQGGKKLNGTIRISGAKNSSVALIPAAILSDDSVVICNVPEITDTDALSDILDYLGADVKRASESIIIDSKSVINKKITVELSKKLRASYYFMGALLGRFKHVEMSFPGGCSIGSRPINLHLKGFEALGAKITEKDDYYIVDAEELRGANIYLDIASVGATINIMLAAVKAKGITIIDNAAKEPEIVNVATFLNNMGAKISGAGTSEIRITGVNKLSGCFHEVIPDRIEAGTYAIIAALCGQKIKIDNIIPEHLEALTSKFKDMSVNIEIGSDYFLISEKDNYKSTNIKTLVFPGFPTDLQQPFTVLLTQANGKSIVEETIWENRFMHIDELNKMGANIKVNGTKAIIIGKTSLHSEEVIATDLRAGAALVCAALISQGTTIIKNAEHILRGYEDIVGKLTDVGAKIEIIEI